MYICIQTARYNPQSIHKGVGTNTGESGAGNLEAESIRSRAKRTRGCVKLKTVTEIRERKALEDSRRDKTKKGPTCRRFPGRCPWNGHHSAWGWCSWCSCTEASPSSVRTGNWRGRILWWTGKSSQGLSTKYKSQTELSLTGKNSQLIQLINLSRICHGLAKVVKTSVIKFKLLTKFSLTAKNSQYSNKSVKNLS